MENEDQANEQMNRESGNDDRFFAAPFVEQQQKEQNADQNAVQSPNLAAGNEAERIEDDNPTDALPMFLPENVGEKPDYRKDDLIDDEFGKNEFGDELGNEEFAAETADMNGETLRPLNQPEEDRPREAAYNAETEITQNAAMGWLALTIAIASLFFWPAILGPAAAIIGFFALTRGNRALGIWSIVIGLVSFMAYIVLIPLYA